MFQMYLITLSNVRKRANGATNCPLVRNADGKNNMHEL